MTVGDGQTAARGPSLVNAANGLTVLRLVLVPVFVGLMLAGGGHAWGWRVAAWGAFAVASCTDRFDGELARRRNTVTEFGKLADPIADKALVGAALVCLSGLGDVPWWVTVVILGRELGVTLLRLWVIRHGVIAASRGGKVKTLLQGVALGLYVLPLTGLLASARAVLLALAVVATLVTGADYVLRALTLRRTSPRARGARADGAGPPARHGMVPTDVRGPGQADARGGGPSAVRSTDPPAAVPSGAAGPSTGSPSVAPPHGPAAAPVASPPGLGVLPAERRA